MAAQIPAYDALRIFADTSAPEAAEAAPATAPADDQIYGANVDGEVSVKVGRFPIDEAETPTASPRQRREIEQIVRAAANFGGGGADMAACLCQTPTRNGDDSATRDPFSALGVKMFQENVSNVAKSDGDANRDGRGEGRRRRQGHDFRDAPRRQRHIRRRRRRASSRRLSRAGRPQRHPCRAEDPRSPIRRRR